MRNPWVTRLLILSVFLVVAKMVPWLGWLLVILALGFAMLWFLHRRRALPAELSALVEKMAKILPGGRSPAMATASPSPQQAAPQQAPASVQPSPTEEKKSREKLRKERAERLARYDPDTMAFELRGRLVGQDTLAYRVARLIEQHLAKDNPQRPLSILLGGPRASGKSTFPKILAETLDSFLFEGKGGVAFLRIDCSAGSGIDWEAAQEAFGGCPLAILHFDDVDRSSAQGGSNGRFMIGLTNAVSSPGLAQTIIVMTTGAKADGMATLFSDNTDQPDQLERAVRTELLDTFERSFLERIDLVTTTAPLSAQDRARLVWLSLAETAQHEYGLVLLDPEHDRATEELHSFMMAGAELWEATGDDGIHEMRRWVNDASRDGLVLAKRAGWKTVVPAGWRDDVRRIEFARARSN